MKTYQIFYLSSDRVSTEPQFISLFLSGNGLYQYLRLIWKTPHYLAVKEKTRWSFEDIQSVQIGTIGNKLYKIYFCLLILACKSQRSSFSSGSHQKIEMQRPWHPCRTKNWGHLVQVFESHDRFDFFPQQWTG